MSLLHSKILGKGEPLLILHGFFGMSDNWKTLGNRFAENYEVHLIDQRNHGRSFHSDEFSYEVMVEDLLLYIEQYKLKNVNLLGHSMGGKVTMLFAFTHPDLVDALIVADIAPRFYPRHHDLILAGLAEVDFSKVRSRNEVEEVLQEYIPEFSVRQFLVRSLYWKSKEQLSFRFNLPSLIENIDEVGMALPSLTVFENRTLFLKGENSGYIARDDESLIEAHFPRAVIKTVKNAGHWLHAENPDDFYRYVVSFLEKQGMA